MNQSANRILSSAMAAIFLLTACAQAPSTPDPVEVANQISTAVALTVAAGNAQTAAAKPTDTPPPTPTEVVPPTLVIPTATPFVIVPPTTVVGGGGGSGGTTTKPDYACDIIRRRPFDNTLFRPNDTFDIKWTIVNTGTKTMQAGLDLKYDDGPQLTTTTLVELPKLEPGEQYAVDFDGIAPAKEGTYIMTWAVEGGLCFPYVAIIVEKF